MHSRSGDSSTKRSKYSGKIDKYVFDKNGVAKFLKEKLQSIDQLSLNPDRRPSVLEDNNINVIDNLTIQNKKNIGVGTSIFDDCNTKRSFFTNSQFVNNANYNGTDRN